MVSNRWGTKLYLFTLLVNVSMIVSQEQRELLLLETEKTGLIKIAETLSTMDEPKSSLEAS